MKWTCAKCGERARKEPTIRLFFMRHGRTKLNEESRTVGSINEFMSDRGREQARMLAADLRTNGVKLDWIVSSPMLRAMETAHIVRRAVNAPLAVDERLRERCVGVLQGQPETPESDAQLLRYDYRPEGAEPLENFEGETLRFLTSLVRFDRKTVLFVTHGFRLLTIVKLIHGWDVPRIMEYAPPGNCEIVEFRMGNHCQCDNVFYEKGGLSAYHAATG